MKKSDHRKIFVCAERKSVPPIVLLEPEWLTLEGKTFLDQRLAEKTRRRLLKVTNIYASSWRDPAFSKSLKIICRKISDWRKNTERLRIAIWKTPPDYNSRGRLKRSNLI